MADHTKTKPDRKNDYNTKTATQHGLASNDSEGVPINNEHKKQTSVAKNRGGG